MFGYILNLADDHLILSHRTSEWCGIAPSLEEDLALSNIALDHLGVARNLYAYAGALEGKQRSEDDFAFLRLEHEFKNCLLVERKNGDFAHTILRLLYFSLYIHGLWQVLAKGNDQKLAEIAAKAVKESAYHLRHASQWCIRLGDGSDESNRRLRAAKLALESYCGELFLETPELKTLIDQGLIPNPLSLKSDWLNALNDLSKQVTFSLIPDENAYIHKGGREGIHGEEMGYLLAQMQYMQRTFPNLTW